MASSNTTLPLLQVGQTGKETQINALNLAASPALLFGRDELASIGLTWRVYGGVFNGSTIADQSVSLTASATNYIEADATTGVVSRNTVEFTVGRLKLYSVVCGAAGPTSWVDFRETYANAAGAANNAKTDAVNVFTKAQGTPPVVNNTATGAVSLDFSASNSFRLTLTGAVTLSVTNPQNGFVYTLQLKQDAVGGRAITWPASFRWPGALAGTLSTAPNAVDMLSLMYDAADAKFNAVLTKAFA